MGRKGAHDVPSRNHSAEEDTWFSPRKWLLNALKMERGSHSKREAKQIKIFSGSSYQMLAIDINPPEYKQRLPGIFYPAELSLQSAWDRRT